MAIIHEHITSRQGGETGDDGTSGENRVFSVTTEPSDYVNVSDGQGGPLRRITPDPRALLAASGLANLGDPHPWNIDIRAYSYSDPIRRGAVNWLVRVNFRDDSIEPMADGEWLVSLRGLSLPRRIIEELSESEGGLEIAPTPRGLPGGSLRARRVSEAEAQPIKLIGPIKYIPVVGPAGDLFKSTEAVPMPTGLAVEKEVLLWPTTARVVEGFDTEWPAMAVTFRRIAANFTIDRAGQLIVEYMKSVNRVEFRGSPPGHVKVDGLSIDPIEKFVPGQTRQGRAWRIEVVFHWSAIAWTPHEIVPAHVSEDGSKRPILDSDGNRVVESFRVRRTRDLETLLTILGSG